MKTKKQILLGRREIRRTTELPKFDREIARHVLDQWRVLAEFISKRDMARGMRLMSMSDRSPLSQAFSIPTSKLSMIIGTTISPKVKADHKLVTSI
jgi:hypothetical protein